MKLKILGTIVALLFVANSAALAADSLEESGCLKWDIKSGISVNKPQSNRLYIEAVRWIESTFRPMENSLKPCLTVHVGQPCPTAGTARNCASPVTGDVFIAKWQENSPGMIAEATIQTGLLHLVDHHEVSRISATFLAQDRRDSRDALSAENRIGK